eukprot:GHVP01004437.1.p1 GENE.GHVP01004437.1~~GHVP01004437.1.p1  ORF type:complete len:1062 (-),score=301.54 GHVP01004437.1:97-3282(-)
MTDSMVDADSIVQADSIVETEDTPDASNDKSFPLMAPKSKKKGRLIIRWLHLENFKSYGGKCKVGPFHSRFSSIIGPNGSGKSNIIDAVLFVFGRKATELRQKKVAHLIHKSAKIPNAQFTRVDVFFEFISTNPISEEEETIEQFSISKETKLDGTSKYYLDDKAIHQKNLNNVLQEKGFNANSNRYLILQGEVEQIAQLKPKGDGNEEGFLEYLESIFGTNRFIEPIQEAQKSFEEHSACVDEKRDLLAATQAEVDANSGVFKEAEMFCRAERKFLVLSSLKEHVKRQSAVKELQMAESIERDATEKEAIWMANRKEKLQEKIQMEDSIRKQKEIMKSVAKQLKKCELSFEELERKDNELTAKQSNIQRRKVQLENFVKKLRLEIKDTENNIHRQTERRNHLEKSIPLFENELSESLMPQLQELEAKLSGELQELRKEKELLEVGCQPLQSSVEKIKSSLDFNRAEAAMITEKEQEYRKRLEALESQSLTHTENLKLKSEKLKECLSEKERTKKEISKLQKDIKEVSETFQTESQTLLKMKMKIEEAEKNMSEARQGNKRERELMEARDAGKLQGLIGPLWNLCDIDPEFRHAVAASTSPELILTKTSKDAQDVIDYVRKRGLGRVTCVVLDDVTRELSSQMENLLKNVQPPQGTSFLLNAIDAHDLSHRVAFYFALRDTVVCENIAKARTVAFSEDKRWKVATLEGQTIDKSGVMTGGQVSTEGFKSNHAKGSASKDRLSIQEVEKLKMKASELSAKVEGIKKKRADGERDNSSLETSLEKTENLVSQLELDVASEKKALENLKLMEGQTSIPELSLEEKKRLVALESNIKKLEEEFEKEQGDLDKKLAEVQKMSEKIGNVGGGKLRNLKEEVEEKTKLLENSKNEFKELEISVAVLKDKKKQKELLIPEKEKEALDEETQDAEVVSQKDKLTDVAEKVLDERDAIQKKNEELINDLKNKERQLQEIVAKFREDDLKEVEFSGLKEEALRLRTKIENSIQKCDKRLRKLKEEFNVLPFFEETEENKIDVYSFNKVVEVLEDPDSISNISEVKNFRWTKL